MTSRCPHRLLFPLLGLGAVSMACNPVVFDKVLEDAPVRTFQMRGPSGPIHSGIVVTYPAGDDGIGHALVPSVEDGARGVKFIAAAIESSSRGGVWTDLRLDL